MTIISEEEDEEVIADAAAGSSASFQLPVKVFFVAHGSENGPFIGEREMQEERKPYIVASTCSCRTHLFLNDGSCEIPPVLTSSGVTDKEIRALLVEVSDIWAERSSCCWRWGYLGPIFLVVWWLDQILLQCRLGLTKFICIFPFYRKVDAILEKHNKTWKSRGCIVSLVRDEHVVDIPYWNSSVFKHQYFEAWCLQFECTHGDQAT
mmetsp:Transcript_31784/g.46740  ORF Transcript_31784/g.46740 Transcript_31784/m.46740 type:complete len:207 (-) Transcript_31784:128-748(-)